MTKYRDNALDPKSIDLVLDLVESGAVNSLYLLIADTTRMGREEYKMWIADWKAMYNALSRDINRVKRDGNHTVAARMRRIANTFMNARHAAKDKRRGVMQLEAAQNA